MNTHLHTTESVVEIATGRISGRATAVGHEFLGIPYGADTGGENRFRPPQPVTPWTGVRECTSLPFKTPQTPRAIRPANAWIRDITEISEDCLGLNVFTPAPDGQAKRPVMVWLHGGGFEFGSGGAPGLHGGNLAQAGDLVVVTLNHRLNVFGFGYFGETDERFAQSGTAGMLDIVQALEWVRDNIAVFGGDPNNVTIFGQSGGGSKVAIMMTMPRARGLFHRAIIQSASSLLQLATPESASRSMYHLRKALGIESPEEIQKIPADALLKGYRAAVEARNKNDSFRAVAGLPDIPNHPFDPNSPDISADIPFMVGSCETEKSFYDVVADPETLPLSDEQLVGEIARFVGIDEEPAAELIAGYRDGRHGMSGRDLFNIISSDHMYRRNDVETAERRAQRGGAPVYLYEFTWQTPVLGGILKTPHTLCIPFAFGNVDVAKEFVGEGAEQDALQAEVMGAWIAFARSGNPNHPGLADWPAFNLKTRPTMIFAPPSHVENNPKPEDLARINAHPRFVSDAQWPEPEAA